MHVCSLDQGRMAIPTMKSFINQSINQHLYPKQGLASCLIERDAASVCHCFHVFSNAIITALL